jgi:hypothetical protein
MSPCFFQSTIYLKSRNQERLRTDSSLYVRLLHQPVERCTPLEQRQWSTLTETTHWRSQQTPKNSSRFPFFSISHSNNIFEKSRQNLKEFTRVLGEFLLNELPPGNKTPLIQSCQKKKNNPSKHAFFTLRLLADLWEQNIDQLIFITEKDTHCLKNCPEPHLVMWCACGACGVRVVSVVRVGFSVAPPICSSWRSG